MSMSSKSHLKPRSFTRSSKPSRWCQVHSLWEPRPQVVASLLCGFALKPPAFITTKDCSPSCQLFGFMSSSIQHERGGVGEALQWLDHGTCNSRSRALNLVFWVRLHVSLLCTRAEVLLSSPPQTVTLFGDQVLQGLNANLEIGSMRFWLLARIGLFSYIKGRAVQSTEGT